MRHQQPKHPLAVLLLVPMLLAAPGCIVQDINDGIGTANENLTSINDSFAKVERANELLTKVDVQLDTVEGQLTDLSAKLEVLERVNEQLASIDKKLTTLNGSVDELQQPLTQIERHLASLRTTINNIDSTIPFLKISGDDAEDKAELEAEREGNDEATETPPDPADQESDDEAGPPKV